MLWPMGFRPSRNEEVNDEDDDDRAERCARRTCSAERSLTPAVAICLAIRFWFDLCN
ncbi:putative basic proline-rich protein-like [Iris pallida]|uniref:Basic proline-rich protein-like n=1 Tax=Iris pallida TaxID=29817 RepID=A0AAX6HH28_IRIPA|nr:putative basic proline-rich protein-like [Iris pallida]